MPGPDSRMHTETAAITASGTGAGAGRTSSRSFLQHIDTENMNPNLGGARTAAASRKGRMLAGSGAPASKLQRGTASALQAPSRSFTGLHDITNLPEGRGALGKVSQLKLCSAGPRASRELLTGNSMGSGSLVPNLFAPAPARPIVPTQAFLQPESIRSDIQNELAVSGPQEVAEYVPQIVAQLFQDEMAFMPRPNFMESQADINGKMRAILIDWLVEVHMKYRLRHETLFLAINLIDRYLALEPVPRKRLQLIGVAGMFVAAKFEEIDPPRVNDFVYITDNTYTKNDILGMECTMLSALGFQVVVPTAVHFLHHLLQANRCDGPHGELARYLLELALVDLRMVKHAPSRLVSAALLLSNELLGRPSVWPDIMAQQSRHAEQALRACAEEMRALLRAAPTSSLQAVRKKYMLQQHHSVARMPIATAA